MNRQEHLLTVTSEECAEIQQAISKGLRFGIKEPICLKPDKTNEMEILKEIYHLLAMVEMLQDEEIIGRLTDDEIQVIKEKKKRNVEKYMLESFEKGLLI